jgi:hypothetical protein
MVAVGFNMKTMSKCEYKSRHGCGGLHINSLELIGIVINTVLALAWATMVTAQAGSHVFKIWAENTSLMPWMKNNAHGINPIICTFPHGNSRHIWYPLYFTGRTNLWGGECGGRPPIATNPEAIVGVHNSGISRGTALFSLENTDHSLIDTSIDNIFGFNHGHCHEKNGCTLDAKACHFSNWIERIDPPSPPSCDRVRKQLTSPSPLKIIGCMRATFSGAPRLSPQPWPRTSPLQSPYWNTMAWTIPTT